jgi:hypothetical protein
MALELDATTLRLKYGEPLARETFHIRPGLEMIVNYGPDRKVCKVEVPGANSYRQLDELIEELAPVSARGRKVSGSRIIAAGGGNVRRCGLYENVVISEPYDLNHPDKRTGVTISFNRPDCHQPQTESVS